jgi:hypothetical protein
MELVRPLSGEDRAILELEHGPVAGHTCKVLILAGSVEADEVRAELASRLERAPELSLRLTEMDGALWWARDDTIDLGQHVVAGTEPPLDEAGLREAVARLFEQRLDRERPLWRLDVIPRLRAGGSALVWRIHHALADGTTAMRIARSALWNEPEADVPALAHKARPNGDPRPRSPRLATLAREAPNPWLRSPFDGTIDSRRSIAFATGDLEALHQVAAATCGATVNDAVLTVVSGGLRRWLEAHHCHVGAVRVKVPVSLHGAEHDHGAGEAGNRDSYFCLDLPLGPADPAVRLETIHRATKARKEDHDAERLDALMHELGKASPRLRRFADHVLTSSRSFALNVSNVPGPRRPIDVLGVPAIALYSIAEIRQHHALRVSVLSLAGTLRFGLCADPVLLPDVEQLADALEQEAAELAAIPATT